MLNPRSDDRPPVREYRRLRGDRPHTSFHGVLKYYGDAIGSKVCPLCAPSEETHSSSEQMECVIEISPVHEEGYNRKWGGALVFSELSRRCYALGKDSMLRTNFYRECFSHALLEWTCHTLDATAWGHGLPPKVQTEGIYTCPGPRCSFFWGEYLRSGGQHPGSRSTRNPTRTSEPVPNICARRTSKEERGSVRS